MSSSLEIKVHIVKFNLLLNKYGYKKKKKEEEGCISTQFRKKKREGIATSSFSLNITYLHSDEIKVSFPLHFGVCSRDG